MLNWIILISGHISSGKSTLAKGLSEKFGMEIFKTRDILKAMIEKKHAINRLILQKTSEKLDKSTRGAWVLEKLMRWHRGHANTNEVVIDAVRIENQIAAIRQAFGPKVIHIHLTAPRKDLEKRFKRRYRLGKELSHSYAKVMADPTEKQVDSLANIADVVINTKRCTPQDVLVRVSSHLRIRCGIRRGYVDIIIGGQYGSEGKGHIASYLSNEYDLLIRVGGPNAGHKIYEEPKPYTHHQLPSGTRRSEALLLIGPGATLRVKYLLQEIAECKVDAKRLRIDPNAVIISDDDIEREKKGVKNISSTGQGVGMATARRISGRLDRTPPKLARVIPELQPFLGSALDQLEKMFSCGGRVLLEGTQGTELSLYHSYYYPFVTSRDTIATGCLSEAGIAPTHVRKIVMVCRTYPIRVKNALRGTSGPMSQEIGWKEIARRSGKNYKQLLKAEHTSTTNLLRRVGEFDWRLLRKAAILNSPTDIALTFTDYLSPQNEIAKRFEMLHPETIKFIQEIEIVTGARVSLIVTGFNYRSIIDRRSW